MLPPRMTGCAGSAARIAAVSDEVVVLPFVPVTPTVGTGQRRRNRSASETRAGAAGSPAARASTSRRSAARRAGSVVGKSGVIEGDVATSAASAQVAAASTSGPSARPHRPVTERGDGFAELRRRSSVVDRDARAGIGEEPGQRDPAPGEAEDRHRPVAQGSRRGSRRASALSRSIAAGVVIVVTTVGGSRRGRGSRRAARRGSRRSRTGS